MASDNPLASEPTYEVDPSFNTAKSETGAKALALRLQTLIITENGTLPNNYSLGIGINQYDFEMLDSVTLDDMQSKITEQISKWIPGGSAYIQNVIVENMNAYDPNITNAVIIAFELGNVSDAKFIGIVLKKDTSTSRVSSEILIH
jgi:hypothetical protein